MTSTGEGWLIACLDPFHDYRLKPEGFPDLVSSNSIVQIHNYSFDVSAPASAAGNNWDCSVIYTGLDAYPTTGIPVLDMSKPFCGGAEYDHADLATYRKINSLTVISDATGVALNPANSTGDFYGLPSFRSSQQGRLIGVAVEVHNTTAEVYRQGSLSVAMLPPTADDVQSMTLIDTNAAPWESKDFQCDSSTYLPSYVADVKSVPQSGTWEARKGVYMIPRLSKGSINPTSATPNRATLVRYKTTGGSAACCTIPQFNEATIGTNPMPYYHGFGSSSFSPMCAFFSGLSDQTTLTVTFRCLVEYFPTVSSEMISLTSPSARHDPKALAAYCAVAESAPYAVPVGSNASGDYFRDVVGAAAQLIPYVRTIYNVGKQVYDIAKPVASNVGKIFSEMSAANRERRAARRQKKDAVKKNQAGKSANPRK